MEQFEKYVYKIYEKRSFSAAARALFVSQPSLSARVAKLEKDLGFKIFDRTSSPLGLTKKGRIYIEYLEEILQSETNMRARINQLSDANSGTITVGGLCHSAYCILPALCREFQKRFPNVIVDLHVGNTRNIGGLLDSVKKQGMDLVLTYRYDYTEFCAVPLMDERLVIAINKRNPEVQSLLPLAVTRDELLSGSYDKSKELTDFSIFKDVSFFRFTNIGNTVNSFMERLEGNCKVSQYRIINKEHLSMQYNLLRAGFATMIASDLHAMSPIFDCDDILYLIPDCPEAHRTLHFVMKNGGDENMVVKSFISLAKEICSEIKERKTLDVSI